MHQATAIPPVSNKVESRTIKALRWLIGFLGEVLVTLGLLLLLFVAWQLWWTDATANREQAATIQALEHGFDQTPRRALPGVAPKGKPITAPVKSVPTGEAFAILRIPRFGSEYARPVLQSTNHDTLIKGVGHYPDAVMPGLIGNFAVAGHRTTYGRPFYDINLLRKGDFIVVETKVSYIVYAVDRHVIVTPNEVSVIAPVPQHPGAKPIQAWMTMTSCNPRYSANQRYVVFARLVTIFPRSTGLPASFTAVPSGVA